MHVLVWQRSCALLQLLYAVAVVFAMWRVCLASTGTYVTGTINPEMCMYYR